MGGTQAADLSVASAFGRGDPGSFGDDLNSSIDSTISATIAIGGPSISRTAWVGLTAGSSPGNAPEGRRYSFVPVRKGTAVAHGGGPQRGDSL